MNQKRENLNMLKWRVRAAAFVVALAAPLVGWAQNTIQAITSSQQAGSEVVRIELAEPLGAVPNGFTVQAPPRVALDLPGIGVCIPDLVFEKGKRRVYLEVLGYWSRDAVWRRVELVQKGLPQKLLFAASQRLRVSEAVLEDHPSGALYVYKGTLSAKAIVERLECLRGR